QLEQELPVVRARRLIAEILDGVVLRPLAVQHGLPHFLDELAMLFLQLLSELGQPLLPHRDLLASPTGGIHAAPAVEAQATMATRGTQSIGPFLAQPFSAASTASADSTGASPHKRSSA